MHRASNRRSSHLRPARVLPRRDARAIEWPVESVPCTRSARERTSGAPGSTRAQGSTVIGSRQGARGALEGVGSGSRSELSPLERRPGREVARGGEHPRSSPPCPMLLAKRLRLRQIDRTAARDLQDRRHGRVQFFASLAAPPSPGKSHGPRFSGRPEPAEDADQGRAPERSSPSTRDPRLSSSRWPTLGLWRTRSRHPRASREAPVIGLAGATPRGAARPVSTGTFGRSKSRSPKRAKAPEERSHPDRNRRLSATRR